MPLATVYCVGGCKFSDAYEQAEGEAMFFARFDSLIVYVPF